MSYPVEKIRNVALVGHQDTGKTSFLEAVLHETKQVTRLGRVDDGNSHFDFSPEEIERRITVQGALARAEWRDHEIHFVDTPGYEDFSMECLGALSAVETGLVFVKAESGAEVGTEKVWQYLDSKPRLIVMTKMDKEHANFDRSLKDLKEKLTTKIVPLHLPIGQGDSFRGVVDVVTQKAYEYTDEGPREIDMPSELIDALAQAREELQNTAAESEDALVETFLEKGVLTPEELRRGICGGVASGSLVPLVVACGVPPRGIGLVLDALVDYAPSPITLGDVKGTDPEGGAATRRPETTDALAAVAFKTLSEINVGDYTYLRVRSGKLTPGMDVLNSTTGSSERIGPLYRLNGKVRSDVEELVAGELGAAVKLKHTHTGNTLCDAAKPIVLQFPATPEPLANIAIRAKGKGDEDKLSNGLQRLHEEDPSFSVTVNAETHQTLLAGQGETHLSMIIGKLKRKFHVEVDTEDPKTPYRETIRAGSDERYRHKKQTGGRGQFGEVHLKLEPLPRGSEFEFVNAVVGGVIPGKFIPAVEKGVREAMGEGVLAGFPVVGVRATVDDGKYHPVDSSEAAFKIAAAHAFKAAVPKAKPVLLEPIYKVQVRVPDEFMGDVMGDLSSRRGRIQGMDQEGSFQIVRAEAPLSELYTYAMALRSLTHGRASHTRTFSHYEEVPNEVAEVIIAERKTEVQAH